MDLRLLAAASLFLSLVVTACDEPTAADVQLLKTTALDDAVGAPANITGVTLDPDSGALLVLDARRGVFRLEDEGTATQLWDGVAMRYGVVLFSEFTDLAALPGGGIAITARSSGYLLDLTADTFVTHFCYEPFDMDEPLSWTGRYQLTDALTFNAATGQLMAQPQTYDSATGEALANDIATFDAERGVDLLWTALNRSDVQRLAQGRSGGMAAVDATNVLVASGSNVFRWSKNTNRFTLELDLAAIGVTTIEGLAFDPERGRLYVVDGDQRLLHTLAYDGQ